MKPQAVPTIDLPRQTFRSKSSALQNHEFQLLGRATAREKLSRERSTQKAVAPHPCMIGIETPESKEYAPRCNATGA